MTPDLDPAPPEPLLAEPSAPRSPLPAPIRRHHWVVRATHWLSFVLLAGMVASGLQIYGAYARFGERGGPFYQPNPFQDRTFPAWARLGGWLAGALNWHFALMWVLIAVGLVFTTKRMRALFLD